jgi:hypothetical protein
MSIRKLVQRGFLGLCMATLLAPVMAHTTLADDKVTQDIGTGGELEAYVADVSLGAVFYSNDQQSSSGTLVLNVDDPRGSSEGWNVTIASSDFVYGGTSTTGKDIPVTGFAFTANGTVSKTAGQDIDQTGGPSTGTISGASLETAQMVISANEGFGSGTYTESLPVALVIPPLSQVGTYTATLTVTITSGP